MIKIVIDTLGGDMGYEPIVRGVAKGLKSGLDFFPVLVGPTAELTGILEEEGIAPASYEIQEASAYIRNEDPPTSIFTGDDTSMAVAYDRLKKDETVGAMLSSGNTGAVLVGSICRLGLLPGLKFPALASALPCNGDNLICLVDCGANIECTSDDLARFARMGNVLAKTYCAIENPRVGLMNVGREKQKGTAFLQETYEKLSKLDLNFIGNVEGSDMVSRYVDVIVTDGYSGNLLLKCAESAGKAAMDIVSQYCPDEAIKAKLNQVLFETFDFNSRGGATFLGPKKTVVKMHGAANADTVVSSVVQVMRLEKARFSQAMAEEMAK